MRLRVRGRRPVIAIVVAAGLVVVVAGAAAVVAAGGQTPYQARDVRISVVDGPADNQHVTLDATFFTPAGTGRVPAILLAHGFNETKYAVASQAIGLTRAGFAVLTWSARGMGASTGQIALDSPQYEVKDVEQLVSWLARQPRVLLDGPGDPRVGIAGASYGGGMALLAAGYDNRIDAAVPEMSWNDLATALFPNGVGGNPVNGVFKRQWASLLFTQGTAGFGGPAPGPSLLLLGGAGGATVLSPECGRFQPSLCTMYQQIAQTGRPTPEALATLRASSPVTVASAIHAPTLLIQGENDSLFGLDQAAATYRQIKANGTPVDLVWFGGGHDGGNQESARIDSLAISWFDRWLKQAPWRPGASRQGQAVSTGQPGFVVSRPGPFDPSTGTQAVLIATAPSFPGLDGSERKLVPLTGPPQVVLNPAGGIPASMSVFPGLGASAGLPLTFDMPGQSATFYSAPLALPLRLTGAPSVRLSVIGPAGATLFAKLYDVDQAGDQTLPFALAEPVRIGRPALSGRPVTITLPAVDYEFAAGHRLALVLTTTDFAYASPSAPAAYQVALASRGVSVPVDPALAVGGTGLPWWVPVAPLVTILLVALILLTGRRRGGAVTARGAGGGDAGVPLEISGLTKRYRGEQLAVDGLDLRVERGQILGLLGPNGAGKTTTLRVLMGLIRADAGTIRIFGSQVGAGSPALARLGAFVEGPGFLPHLSGRANLELYWRSIGRPAMDPRLPEVLAIAGLGAAIDRKVRTYSRGMCQRLAIAQAMLGMPDLLVLDEPLNGLDPPQIREMRDVLIDYAAGGRTVVLSSHLLAEVEQTCTHVVVMNNGRLVAAGPVAEIIGDGGSLLIGTSDVTGARRVLTGLPGIGEVAAQGEAVLVHPGSLATPELVAALVRAGVPVERVTPSRRLEDAFLAMIGPGEHPAELEPAEAGR